MPTKTVNVGSSSGCTPGPPPSSPRPPPSSAYPSPSPSPAVSPVDAGSALLIMTLGAKLRRRVEVASDDQAALEKIADLVEQDLDA